MEISKVREYLGEDWTAVQSLIAGALSSDIELLNSVNASILGNAGKQLRPMISLLVARACLGAVNSSECSDALKNGEPSGASEPGPGGEKTPMDIARRYAAAAELLHNATLLHDDVADDSDFRRGKPTVRSILGPSSSVLVGDFWLVKAIGLILGEEGSQKCDERVVRLFSRTLSLLAEGEMLQLQKAQTADTTYEDYLRIIYSKTASLFEAAAVSSALAVNAREEIVESVRNYAVYLGYAFQIKDDILDYCGTSSVGKPLGVDIAEQKITLPLLGAMANAPAKESYLRSLIKGVVERPSNRDEILRLVVDNRGIEYSVKYLEAFVGKAVEALSPLSPSRDRELLEALARFTAQRVV